jgi:HlyD family secretion protein
MALALQTSSSMSTAAPAIATPAGIDGIIPGRSSGKRRILLLAGLALVVAAIGALGAWRWRRADQPRVRYETALVTRGALQARVTASGNVSALVTVQVGSQVSGRIKKLFVDFNSPVRKGQLVALVDPMLFEAALEQADANHAAAVSNLDKARVQLEDAERQAGRYRALWDQRVAARADVDTAETNLGVAKAQLAAAGGAVQLSRAARHQAAINLAYTRIVSPIDGVVISRNVDVGQTVAASFQSPTLFVVAEDLRKMQVDTSVAEADVGKLAAGMTAQFTVDAYPSEMFKGTIREVRNAPQTIQNVVTYDAVIDVDNSRLELKPGMTANVTVVHAERRDVLKVPNAALRFRPPGAAAAAPKSAAVAATPDARSVWILREGRPERIGIRVGLTDGVSTELVSGALRAGDALVTETIGGNGGGPGSFGRVL